MFQMFLVKKKARDFGCVCKVLDAPNSTGLNQLTCINSIYSIQWNLGTCATCFGDALHFRKSLLEEGQP